ncbi:MAG: twitching motility protein PilT [Euryarchaeota archaeon]|nr:twitching motility protein PilT [Euryarchaeota archaeon]
MIVVLDTNALMMPFEFGINLDMELERLVGAPRCVVPSCVVGELRKLARNNRYAKAALALSKKYDVIEVVLPGDRGVKEAAKRTGGYVVTNDRKFAESLMAEGIKVITLKNNHLVIEND